MKAAELLVLEPLGRVSQVGGTVADFKSYADFGHAVAASEIPAGVRWVMYDNERWPQTPVSEQENPAHYEALFAGLAHLHGYKVILAPAQDLVFGLTKPGVSASSPAWQRYLALGLATASARAGDMFEIQAQSDELGQYRSAATYTTFVSKAAAQARAANSRVVILAGLSTQRVTSASQLAQDFTATRSLVAGYWLNIPGSAQPGPLGIAEGFLDGPQSPGANCPSAR